MSLSGKKIWIDVEEPKTGIMFNSLFKMFEDAGAELLITARDFDSTFRVMDDLEIPYTKVGRHGGALLKDKLKTYIDRLSELFEVVVDFQPDFFVTFSSVEGPRIAFGLQIPSIGINDEPRNEPVCKLIFPYLDEIITQQCIPQKLYEDLYAKPEKIIRYNGIDEIGWLSHYKPNIEAIKNQNLNPGKFVLIRSEMSTASYFVDKMKPEETLISEFFPQIFEACPDYKYIIILRTKEQEEWLKQKLGSLVNNDNVIITRYMPNIVDLCYYGALIISGGGTIVRESSLLSVPSIEFFPGESAPQEIFLINNGFPLEHIRDTAKIAKRSIEILRKGPDEKRFTMAFVNTIEKFDNPNKILFNRVKDRLSLKNS